MLGIQPFKNFYKWGCLFLGIPVDVLRQDGLMVQLRAVRSTRHFGARAHREVLDEELNDSDDEGEDAYPRYYVVTRSRAHSY